MSCLAENTVFSCAPLLQPHNISYTKPSHTLNLDPLILPVHNTVLIRRHLTARLKLPVKITMILIPDIRRDLFTGSPVSTKSIAAF